RRDQIDRFSYATFLNQQFNQHLLCQRSLETMKEEKTSLLEEDQSHQIYGYLKSPQMTMKTSDQPTMNCQSRQCNEVQKQVESLERKEKSMPIQISELKWSQNLKRKMKMKD